jgi:hypothetical protein
VRLNADELKQLKTQARKAKLPNATYARNKIIA